jgi:hypothetical protein
MAEPIPVADPLGAFHIDRLPPGRYDLAVYTDDGRRAELAALALREAEAKQGIRLVADR